MQQIPHLDPWIVRGTVIAPCVPTIVQLLRVIAISDRLPGQIATYRSGGDMSNGFMPPVQSALVTAIIVIACAQIGWPGTKTRTPLVICKPIAITDLALHGFSVGVELAIIIPQINTTDLTTARIDWAYAVAGVIIGLVAILFVTRYPKDYSSLTDATVIEPTSPHLPYKEGDPALIDASVTISKGVKIAFVVWCVIPVTLLVFLPSLGIISLLCASLFFIVYEIGMTLSTNLNTDPITAPDGCGPLKMKYRIEFRAIRHAKPAAHNRVDSGGIGLRLGNDSRIIVVTWSGEAVKIEASGFDYTIVVPDGMIAAVAGEINSRTDAIRQQAIY